MYTLPPVLKTTHRWLLERCPHGLSPEAAAEVLQSLGHEVAGVEPLPGGDALIELEITANRPDCLSVLGLAHELAASTGKPLAPLPAAPGVSGEPPQVQVLDPQGCPRYTARLIRDVHVGPSSPDIRGRLEAIGLKPISNVVDATNYVLFELGQPLHAFDADRLTGGITVRRARAGERLKTLDGVDRTLTADMLVIADDGKPVALAGIMGGMDTAVTSSTRNVLLESALFDPALVRRTARALNLASDSSYRFERGVDPAGLKRASDRAAGLIGGVAGPCAASPETEPAAPLSFRLRSARLEVVLGFAVKAEEVERILRGLGCTVASEGNGNGTWTIRPPSRRARDIRTEAEAAEEVARVLGYDRIPARIALPARPGRRDPFRDLAALVSERLRAAGFSEAVSTSFTAAPDAAGAGSLALRNPMTQEQSHLRTSLLPGLMASLAHNQSVGEGVGRLFEIGRTYSAEGETWRLGLAAAVPLREMRGALESALGALGLELSAAPGRAGPFLEDGRSLELSANGAPLGLAGSACPKRTRAVDLRKAPMLAEIALEPLLPLWKRDHRFQPLPRFPGVERDLAVTTDETVTWAAVEAAVRSVPCAYREGLALFDLYRGKQAGEGRKSFAFRIRFRNGERTLTGEEVDAVMTATVAALEKAGAQVRR